MSVLFTRRTVSPAAGSSTRAQEAEDAPRQRVCASAQVGAGARDEAKKSAARSLPINL